MVDRFMDIKRKVIYHVTPGDTGKNPAHQAWLGHSGINAHNVLITSIARMRQQNAPAKPALDRIGLGEPMTSNFGVFFPAVIQLSSSLRPAIVPTYLSLSPLNWTPHQGNGQ